RNGGCPFIREALVTGGKEFTQPEWNLTTLAATFLENGHAFAHKMAKKHPGYSYEETETLWERKNRERQEKGIGWPSCKAIQSEGCKSCTTCLHLGKIKYPLILSVGVRSPTTDKAAPPKSSTIEAKLPAWVAEELKVEFTNTPHRRWLYGTYLVRGEITV